MKKSVMMIVLCVLLAMGGVSHLDAHCQIPCGIYDDMLRVNLMLEHVATIEKSMTMITKLSTAKTPDWNQLVRWVSNKDHHADELSDIVTYYFMAQRIKPVHGEAAAEKKYLNQLTLLHAMMIHAMQAKQTVDPAHCQALRELIGKFKTCYFAGKDIPGHTH